MVKGDLHSSPGSLTRKKTLRRSLSLLGPHFIHLQNKLFSVLCRPPSSELLEELVKKCKLLGPTLRLSESESGVGDQGT